MRTLLLLATAASLIGRWNGAISFMGTDLGIQVEFAGHADSLNGTIDIPMQNVTGWQLRDVRVRGDSLSFAMPPQGPPASFRGIVRGDSILGAFLQPPITASLRLGRGIAPTAAKVDSALPYAQEEVRVPSGSIALAGTLTRPHGTGPFPAIVLVSGSGPQNRDESIYGFKPFAILANHLTRHGIAVLRTDDRGIGGSGGDSSLATSRDFADDLRASVRFLAMVDVDRHRIGALGHSEGGIIAPMAAAGSDSIAFVVMLAGTGVRGDSVILDQAVRIGRATGLLDTMLALNRIAQEKVIHAALTDQGWDEARKATDASMRFALHFQGIPFADSVLAELVEAKLEPMKSAWMRTFLSHDPGPVLAKVRCPVLALFAANDLQVAPEVNAPAVERALKHGGNRDVTVRILPRANHLFQETDDGNPALYPKLPKQFVPGLLDSVTTWVTARTRPRASGSTRAAKR